MVRQSRTHHCVPNAFLKLQSAYRIPAKLANITANAPRADAGAGCVQVANTLLLQSNWCARGWNALKVKAQQRFPQFLLLLQLVLFVRLGNMFPQSQGAVTALQGNTPKPPVCMPALSAPPSRAAQQASFLFMGVQQQLVQHALPVQLANQHPKGAHSGGLHFQTPAGGAMGN